jgi:adenylosuccinate synthase
VGDRELALRIVPSGVMHERVELFIGGGTVISLAGIIDELDRLAGIGIDTARIKISDRAHIVFPHHAQADKANEAARGTAAIGTTGRGIGPAYVDKVARTGMLFADLRDDAKLTAHLKDPEVLEATRAAAKRLLPHVVDGVAYIHKHLAGGSRVLIEGAQGSLLDVGYGTYPYVTSSHTIAGGACIGLGIGPTAIGSVVGVVKAYCTRVGAGPFPTELLDERGEQMRRNGGEFGTVTGRPRRCGWFDAVAGRYAVELNGLTSAVITKLDVLTGFERLGIVTGYRVCGGRVGFGAAADPRLDLEIEELEGWTESLDGCRTLDDLPAAARRYVERIEALLGVPVDLVSVGRERRQLVPWN